MSNADIIKHYEKGFDHGKFTWVGSKDFVDRIVASFEDRQNGVVKIGGPAPTLTSGNCTEDCSQCMEHFYENTPTDIWY